MPESSPQSSSSWTSVRVRPAHNDESARQACLAALFSVGAQGVHEDTGSLVTHFAPDTDLVRVHAAITEADELAVIETSPVPDIDWSEAWKARLVAHELGALTVTPPWLSADMDPARTIIIDPGMAFGTGDHATTRGVIRLLPSVLRAGDIVADLGAGSAVLAIAAAKLGASRVYAIELDGEAIADAEQNVQRNGVADRVHVFEGDAAAFLPVLAPLRVVLANIISSVLVELLPVIATSITSDGGVIISGILREERTQMLDVLAATGWTLLAEDAEDIWWSASIARG